MPALSYPDLTQTSAGHQTAISSRADYASSGNRQSSTELWFTDDNYYAAIDQVFKNLGDELRSEF
ncbi:MAG TPA: hypothetical protein DCF63_11485 [Planctomycetaceae bacterium]|nr:hypothetical protein [Planctomycetaceae bacterium]